MATTRSVDSPPRPLLRYHGGKWRLAPNLLSYFPPHRIYTEVYGGAASVLLRKPRSFAEIYNDLDGEIVNLFRVVRHPQQSRELERQLRLTPYAREEFDASYCPDRDPIEQARRTVVRASMGFGSSALARHTGFRIYTGDGRSATPASDWTTLPDLIPVICERLRTVYVEHRPALDVLQRHDTPTTLHYVDPPYVASTRTTRTLHYHAGYTYEMEDADHRDLATRLHTLKGMVILSGYACPLYETLFGTWLRIDVAALADGARPRRESLWLNPAAQRHQSQLSLDLSPA